MRDEVLPKNIIMIGPTGVGKTEIARRLANLVKAPFLKVEASKYTEVGYVGRDVESMVRDLVEISVNKARSEELKAVREEAKKVAEERLLDVLVPRPEGVENLSDTYDKTRERFKNMLKGGELDEREVEIEVETRSTPMMQVFSSAGIEHLGFDLQNFFERFGPAEQKNKKMKVKEAFSILVEREAENLLDKEKVKKKGLRAAEESGIIFIDELDKIAGRETKGHGPDVSREGVQRDLLPILEGTTVLTRYGPVKTDHILFIGAGAFNVAKPSDLIPELQGRFPIRVELSPLGEEEFLKIMTEPDNALTKQYKALLSAEKIEIEFDEKALATMAQMAAEVNRKMENIGARRLYTIFEKLLEDILFDAPELSEKKIIIDSKYVKQKLGTLIQDIDASRYIL
jgi:ATP-dependent HslUV protease ATP-binding subunit HslU